MSLYHGLAIHLEAPFAANGRSGRTLPRKLQRATIARCLAVYDLVSPPLFVLAMPFSICCLRMLSSSCDRGRPGMTRDRWCIHPNSFGAHIALKIALLIRARFGRAGAGRMDPRLSSCSTFLRAFLESDSAGVTTALLGFSSSRCSFPVVMRLVHPGRSDAARFPTVDASAWPAPFPSQHRPEPLDARSHLGKALRDRVIRPRRVEACRREGESCGAAAAYGVLLHLLGPPADRAPRIQALGP